MRTKSISEWARRSRRNTKHNAVRSTDVIIADANRSFILFFFKESKNNYRVILAQFTRNPSSKFLSFNREVYSTKLFAANKAAVLEFMHDLCDIVQLETFNIDQPTLLALHGGGVVNNKPIVAYPTQAASQLH